MAKQTALLLIFLIALTGGCRKKPPRNNSTSTPNEAAKNILTAPNGIYKSADDKPESQVTIIQKPSPPRINTKPEPAQIDTEPETLEKKSESEKPKNAIISEIIPASHETTEIPTAVTQEKIDTSSDLNTSRTPEINQQPDQTQTQLANNGQSAPADPNKTTAAEPPEKTEEDNNTRPAEKREPLSDFMKQDFMQACDYIFTNFVDENGNVDYITLRRKKQELLDAARYIADLPTEKLLSWSDEQKISFWINAHNILTVKLIIDNYPIKPHWWAAINYPANSIKQITGAREKLLFRIAGFQYKLEEIEHDLLKGFKDPRICFALSYAARSGAILRNEAYDPDKLDEQLDDQVRKYLAKEENFSIDKSNRKIMLSSMLKLKNPKAAFENSEYSTIKRFREKPADIRAFLNFILFYLPPEDIKTLAPMDFDVDFKIYDWELNEKNS